MKALKKKLILAVLLFALVTAVGVVPTTAQATAVDASVETTALPVSVEQATETSASAVLDAEEPVSEEQTTAQPKAEVVPEPEPVLVPTITATTGKTTVGTPIKLESLFAAKDPEGNVLPVVVTGTVNFDKIGTYEISGSVTLGTETATANTTVTVVRNDNAALVALFEKASTYEKVDYTAASYEVLQSAIRDAEAVIANENATKVQIAEATKTLQAAIDALAIDERPYGLIEDAKGLRYFDMETREPYVNRWRTVDGNTYYFGADTYAVAGLLVDSNKLVTYYFDQATHVQYKERWKTIDGNTYYFNANGVPTVGAFRLAGVQHYFGEDGVQFKSRWKTFDGNTYYFNANGVATTGLKKDVNGALYFFGQDGAQYKNRWKTVDGNTYYFNANGVAVKGTLILDGTRHFFDENGVQYKNRWRTIDGNTYYFNANGVPTKGAYRDQNGVLHYFDDNGVQYKNRWKTLDGKTYFFNAKGAPLKGLVRIDNVLTYFGNDGVQYKGKFANVGSNTYYFNENGSAHSGLLRLTNNGDVFYFNPTSKVQTKSAFVNVNGNMYYFNANGATPSGWYRHANGHSYYIDPATRIIRQNAWVDKDGGSAYVDASGRMVTGSYSIGGRRYTFNNNGLVIGNWSVQNGVFRKYNSNGAVTTTATVGNSYILVDLTNQDMYAYKNNSLLVSTDVITGKAETPTPAGNYKILYKQRNRTLRGPLQPNGEYEWSSFVNYWIMFRNGGYGIHDASWQASWKYELSSPNRNYGSHGCVNTPYNKVKTIYENFGLGTPVIVFN